MDHGSSLLSDNNRQSAIRTTVVVVGVFTDDNWKMNWFRAILIMAVIDSDLCS